MNATNRRPLACIGLLARLLLALFAVGHSGASLANTQMVTVTRNVNLRSDPSTEHPPIRLLTPPEQLLLLDTVEEDGYLHVRTSVGQEGWVWVRNLTLDAATFAPAAAAIAGVISPSWDKPAPNKSTFTGVSGGCGWEGVGEEKDSNQRKNRTDIPTSYHDVNFKAISELEYPVGPKNRSNWSVGDLAEIQKFEGVAVRVQGFLVAVRPQTGSAEGTNCRFTKAAETDWHMALVENAGDGEQDAVVVETTPRIRKRHLKWTKKALND